MSGYLQRLARKALQAGPQVRAAAMPFGAEAALQPEAWSDEERASTPITADPPAEVVTQVPDATAPVTRAAPPRATGVSLPVDTSQPRFQPLLRAEQQAASDAHIEHAPAAEPRAEAAADEPARVQAASVAGVSPATAPTARVPPRSPVVHDDRLTPPTAEPPEPLVRQLPASPAGRAAVAVAAVPDPAAEPRRASAPHAPLVHPAVPASPAQRPRTPPQRAAVPTRERAPAQDEATTVHVTIGRIEIAAVQPPTAPARPVAPGARPLSLDDYLARRSRR